MLTNRRGSNVPVLCLVVPAAEPVAFVQEGQVLAIGPSDLVSAIRRSYQEDGYGLWKIMCLHFLRYAFVVLRAISACSSLVNVLTQVRPHPTLPRLDRLLGQASLSDTLR